MGCEERTHLAMEQAASVMKMEAAAVAAVATATAMVAATEVAALRVNER